MKTCTYKKYKHTCGFGYGWAGTSHQHCIWAVIKGKNIGYYDLKNLTEGGEMSYKELEAIKCFDYKIGDKQSLNIIKKLAERKGINLVEVKQ